MIENVGRAFSPCPTDCPWVSEDGVYRDVLKYIHKNNEFGEGTLLNRANSSTLFPFLYFDLTKLKMDIKDGTTKLTFKYELSGATATAYSVYALTLYEQDVELIQKGDKILLTS